MKRLLFASTIAASMAISGAAAAQTNLEKLGAFRTTGVTDFSYVEQGGANAAAIRENLKRVKLPAGFKIDL